jgi:hypothetical protein
MSDFSEASTQYTILFIFVHITSNNMNLPVDLVQIKKKKIS